jgi:HAD superfamily hydrolase (TIGR01549 family)
VRFPIFDLDGTLLDTDAALVAAFVALGVPPEQITFGHVLDDECARFGISVDEYLAAYDPNIAEPFADVEELLAELPRWAVCSNKHPSGGHAELARLGWHPDAVFFSDAFSGRSKRLGPVLAALGADPEEVVFVGDTVHDVEAARDAGVAFVLAGWNPRTAGIDAATVLASPLHLLPLLGE